MNYQYIVHFEAHEMVSMWDKIPTEKEALVQLDKSITSKKQVYLPYSPDWKMTQVIRLNEDGDQEYLVYDGNRWVTQEDLAQNYDCRPMEERE